MARKFVSSVTFKNCCRVYFEYMDWSGLAETAIQAWRHDPYLVVIMGVAFLLLMIRRPWMVLGLIFLAALVITLYFGIMDTAKVSVAKKKELIYQSERASEAPKQ
jgi:hypothetical protein